MAAWMVWCRCSGDRAAQPGFYQALPGDLHYAVAVETLLKKVFPEFEKLSSPVQKQINPSLAASIDGNIGEA